MTLIKSISGIRGTLSNEPGEHLTPEALVKFTSAYGSWLKQVSGKENGKVVVGRDARLSGPMVDHLVCGTLLAMGLDVVNLDMAPTPTVELAVVNEQAQGGIILTASHNPVEWNALKLLNGDGEFLNEAEGKAVLDIAEKGAIRYANVHHLGTEEKQPSALQQHIDMILELPEVDVSAISGAGFKVVVDGINSVGGIALPPLLRALGVEQVVEINCQPSGHFAHTPEPLPENLQQIRQSVVDHHADVGFVVDPDGDRLAIVNEDGSMFGEEYTLVAVADYILGKTPGNTVSNLSSTKALRELTTRYGGNYYPSAVGEVNVVEKMKQQNAVIGGEGNGGVIFPGLHYGRDALVGVALFLSHLALSGEKCSQVRQRYPFYHIIKNKIQLTPDMDVDHILERMKQAYRAYPQNDIDGLKIHFSKGWVHLRKSNTEPIIRLYCESDDEPSAQQIAREVMHTVEQFME